MAAIRKVLFREEETESYIFGGLLIGIRRDRFQRLLAARSPEELSGVSRNLHYLVDVCHTVHAHRCAGELADPVHELQWDT